MKTTTFLMGALAGATLVMIARRSRMVNAAAGMVGEHMKSRWSGMKEDAIGRMVTRKFGGKDNSSARGRDSHSRSEHADSHRSGLSELSHLAERDPDVKEAMDEIFSRGGEHRN
ncbi:hypothetical protein [Cohnella fermenti]|uniref:Uncharacterized protein n=1 Tax=Cohnella fermenti TaxID=2565925 RepID=A0A4S4BUS9_9BACL|nr:hypothetical protein [Cohnella fermenti]THF78345.1 hypothetical protein E6C55_14090 [Cohnella fermenti]